MALDGASHIAALIVEPMTGSAGVFASPQGYLQRLREITRAHGILLIFDEVITGFGRLGHAFAAERYGVVPDMITFAKRVTSGAAPLGGVLVREHIHEAFMQGPEHVPELAHGFTYSGHPLGVAAANAALDLYRDEGLFERARSLEPVFADAVHGLKGFPRVVDIRSIGLAAGIDLAPIDGAPGLRGARALDAAFFDEDLVIPCRRRHAGAGPRPGRLGGAHCRHRRQSRPFFAGAALRLLALALPLLAAIKIPTGCQIAVALQGLSPHDFCERVGQRCVTLSP